MSETIRVDIWSDIACPWCFIGKRRFERAVDEYQREHPEVTIEVEAHSYELAPDTPETYSGSEIDFLVTHKGMPRQQVEAMLGDMTELAKADDIDFDFEHVQHINTRRAHRLLHLAKQRGTQSVLLEALFRAYFSEGKNLADDDELVRLAGTAGIDADAARAALQDATLGEAVDHDIRRAREIGVNGVPFFLLNEKYGVSGAQATDAFVDVFSQVRELTAADSTTVS